MEALIKAVYSITIFLLTRFMHIQNNDITPANSQRCTVNPIANKICSFIFWYYSVLYKISCKELMIFVCCSTKKKYHDLTLSTLSRIFWTSGGSQYVSLCGPEHVKTCATRVQSILESTISSHTEHICWSHIRFVRVRSIHHAVQDLACIPYETNLCETWTRLSGAT